MSRYLEVPKFNQDFAFRTLLCDGWAVTKPHFHKEIEIIYALRGQIYIGVGSQIITLREGESFFFSSGESHYFLASPDSERLVYQFDLKVFDEALLGKDELNLFELFEKGEPHSAHWPAELEQRVNQQLQELFKASIEPTVSNNFRMNGLLNLIAADLIEELPLRTRPKNYEKPLELKYQETLDQLNCVFEYIENHYDEPLTLEQVAKQVGFSSYYFSRFFKKNTGQTFSQFLTDYRIMQAKFILASEKLPMVEVAERSGFASVKTFHHVFKQAVGVSPLKYQKKMS